jgi:hypothetical protein
MSKAFEARPDSPAIHTLLRLHSDLASKVQANKEQREKLLAQVAAAETVIRLFDPAFELRKISARRRVTGNPWFKRGECFRRLGRSARGYGPFDDNRDCPGHAGQAGRSRADRQAGSQYVRGHPKVAAEPRWQVGDPRWRGDAGAVDAGPGRLGRGCAALDSGISAPFL